MSHVLKQWSLNSPYDEGNIECVVDDVCCLTTGSSTGCLPTARYNNNTYLARYILASKSYILSYITQDCIIIHIARLPVIQYINATHITHQVDSSFSVCFHWKQRSRYWKKNPPGVWCNVKTAVAMAIQRHQLHHNRQGNLTYSVDSWALTEETQSHLRMFEICKQMSLGVSRRDQIENWHLALKRMLTRNSGPASKILWTCLPLENTIHLC